MKTTSKEKRMIAKGLKVLWILATVVGIAFATSVYADTPQQSANDAKQLFNSHSDEDPATPLLNLPSSTPTNGQTQEQLSDQEKLRKLLESSTISDQAFSKTAKELMPLTPEQIKTLHYLFDKTQQAVSAYPETPPKPVMTTVNVDLSPGATPPVIRLSSGLVTSLVFMDSTSAPWPIEWYDIGDPKRFNVKADPQSGSNTMMIQALTTYKSANIAVKLKGLSTPVMLTLLPGQNSVDYRVDLRVPGIGPNAVSTGDGFASTSDPDLLNVLNGVPPANSQTLNVFGGEAEAWRVGDKLYIRTRMTVLSPGWVSRMTSGDGTNAYELPVTPIVLALDHGATVTLQIKEQ
jgi:intracellular multiplication protein IcmK